MTTRFRSIRRLNEVILFIGKHMRILCVDIRMVGRPNHDWKEGYEFMYAFRRLGIHCDIAGPHGMYLETDIPRIARLYDLILITENYPEASGWRWWNWESIPTPKFFWAIDTHLVDYRRFIREARIQYVGFGIRRHMLEYGFPRSMPLYYALSREHQYDPTPQPKEYNVVFVGRMITDRRRELCARFGIEHKEAYGSEYFKTMKKARICFNNSITNDINAKYFEIMGSGSFMLTNHNQELLDLCAPVQDDLRKCMYSTDDEIGEKIQHYLEHEEEREAIAKRLYEYAWTYHTWEHRCKEILRFIGK